MAEQDLLLRTIIRKLEDLDEKYERSVTLQDERYSELKDRQNETNLELVRLRSEISSNSKIACPRDLDAIKEIVYNVLNRKGIRGELESRTKTRDILTIISSLTALAMAGYSLFLAFAQNIPKL